MVYKDIAPEDILRMEQEGKMETTKRDWTIKHEGLETQIVDGKGRLVAIPYIPNDGTPEELDTIVRLIATAPDMLQALKDIREFVLGVDALGPTDGQVIAAKCQLALAKAEKGL